MKELESKMKSLVFGQHGQSFERIFKRKLRKSSQEVENEETEQFFSRMEVESVLSNRDLEDITKNVENSVLRKIKDTDIS